MGALVVASDVKYGRSHACDEGLARLASFDPKPTAGLDAVLSNESSAYTTTTAPWGDVVTFGITHTATTATTTATAVVTAQSKNKNKNAKRTADRASKREVTDAIAAMYQEAEDLGDD